MGLKRELSGGLEMNKSTQHVHKSTHKSMNKLADNSKKQRSKLWVIWLMLLGVAAYLIWPFIVGGGEMSNFCKALALSVGATQSDVQRLAHEHGYNLYVNEQGVGIISDARSMGRFICQAQFSQGRLISANYFYND